MKYMLLMYGNENAAVEFTNEKGPEAAKEWFALLKEANDAGVMVSTNGLLPIADATTVRVRNGKTLTTDGPFAETHEQLGGYFILDCKDLDEAIAWAARIPHARYGSIEIRPLWTQK
jgi:hypothetical protein